MASQGDLGIATEVDTIDRQAKSLKKAQGSGKKKKSYLDIVRGRSIAAQETSRSRIRSAE